MKPSLSKLVYDMVPISLLSRLLFWITITICKAVRVKRKALINKVEDWRGWWLYSFSTKCFLGLKECTAGVDNIFNHLCEKLEFGGGMDRVFCSCPWVCMFIGIAEPHQWCCCSQICCCGNVWKVKEVVFTCWGLFSCAVEWALINIYILPNIFRVYGWGIIVSIYIY